jgi:hypothetical protein
MCSTSAVFNKLYLRSDMIGHFDNVFAAVALHTVSTFGLSIAIKMHDVDRERIFPQSDEAKSRNDDIWTIPCHKVNTNTHEKSTPVQTSINQHLSTKVQKTCSFRVAQTCPRFAT